ncbi:hypothetical protein WSK_1615 [Novosphingobium sp. Rr 2-17]|uniref:glycosyltransferase family 2 protein n=1 Tax=Novosphingobium sp. Rr 2-17 TaxID=555793 RepID=UPI0002699B91|nr:glycosyltransferase [Novosphingobium sp. Rr 2-17]EIZ79790.1 hypothetical protein WSK_1615 [Novosphingobium sp. Rr 2-17]
MTNYAPLQKSTKGRVSILIPSYVRPDDLRHTLATTFNQTYPDYEVLIVDDGTPDDAIEKVAAEYKLARYIRTPHNIGLIAARNFGAERCTGEFILNLDDDSWLEGTDDLAAIVEYMRLHPKCGVISLNIGLPGQGYLWEQSAPSAPQRTYKGCGNVYRREVLEQVGGYLSEFYRQGEEIERSLRIIDRGYEIMSLPSVRVFHAQSSINRNMRKHFAYEAVNMLRRELVRAPLWLLPLGITRTARFVLNHKSDLDFDLLKRELFGKRVPLFNFVRAYRRPVKTRTYLHALRLP